jgi:Flp pilus assembly protein CpaB
MLMAISTESLRAGRSSPPNRREAKPNSNGLQVTGPVKRRPTWAIAGAGLVVLAMLLGAWVFTSQSTTVAVMVAARDIEPGQVLTAADLQVVELANAGALRAVQSSQQQLLVGRAARGPIPAGTVLNTGLVVDAGAVVPSGEVVVGVAVDAGASPTNRLAAGDLVEVLAVARTVTGVTDDAATAATVLTTASVWAAEPIGTGATSAGKTWVSLLIPRSAHTQVAQAAAEGRLRLGLLGAGS